ncbi:hypothetical protein ACYCFK_05425 [Stutzerimonas stutzeri]
MKSLELMQLRGELEDVGNTLSLLVDITSSGLALSERGQAGLLDLGVSALNRLDEAVGALQHYEDGNAPS